MKKLILIFVVVTFLFSGNIFAGDKAKIDEPAPVFTLVDSEGKEHSLTDYKGKYVVLEWINFGCPFVKKHYNSKNMQKLQKKYTEEGVIWLSICSSAEGKQGYFEKTEIEEKIKELGGSMTAYLIDESGEVGKMYAAKTTPHMYVIDTSGVLVYAGGIDDRPSADEEDVVGAKNYVAEALDALLKEEEIKVKVSKPYGCSVKYGEKRVD
ncbi:thioredoxin family protein [Bacteroidota bacterium]